MIRLLRRSACFALGVEQVHRQVTLPLVVALVPDEQLHRVGVAPAAVGHAVGLVREIDALETADRLNQDAPGLGEVVRDRVVGRNVIRRHAAVAIRLNEVCILRVASVEPSAGELLLGDADVHQLPRAMGPTGAGAPVAGIGVPDPLEKGSRLRPGQFEIVDREVEGSHGRIVGSPRHDAILRGVMPDAAGLAAHLDWLYGRLNFERLSPGNYSLGDFKLDRMRRLLAELGDPQFAMPCVHVAGSKGKGSVVHLVDAAVRACGYRVGRFTSPHIERFNERIAIGGQPIGDAELSAAFEVVRPVVVRLDASDQPLTFFEIGTALGWIAFDQAGCDLVVLEVGLGGRLDSTNVCRPVATAIVSISHDHGQILGDGLDAIATEKAGIIKDAVPVVTGPLPPEAAAVVDRIAGERNAPLDVVGGSIVAADGNGGAVVIQTPGQSLTVRQVLRGEHQRDNLAVAAGLLGVLSRSGGFDLDPGCLQRGLERVQLPLRAEVIQRQPLVVLDVAHNGASVRALIDTADRQLQRSQSGRRVAIFGTSSDKHIDEMLAEMRGAFDVVCLTEYSTNPRALPLAELHAMAARLLDGELVVADSVPVAIASAMERLRSNDDSLLVFGSFFLASEVVANWPSESIGSRP